MDLQFTAEEEDFRQEVRAFIKDHLPERIRQKLIEGRSASKDDIVEWTRILHKKGWSTPRWPVELGGTGWSAIKQYIFLEEGLAAPAPELLPFGVSMVGPVIYTFGNAAQKARYLPPIANLDEWWCQGFSEPGAGSDLAAVATRAVRQGDHYVVNGQKTWTTYAQHADWIFCLCRTDTGAKKQEGISFLLIDMKSPGIAVRPIQTIDGGHEINEVFFDEVKVPVDNRVGEENKGWDYAKFLLSNERVGIARVGTSKARLRRLRELAAIAGPDGRRAIDRPRFRDRLIETETCPQGPGDHAIAGLVGRGRREIQRPPQPCLVGPENSWIGTATGHQRIAAGHRWPLRPASAPKHGRAQRTAGWS